MLPHQSNQHGVLICRDAEKVKAVGSTDALKGFADLKPEDQEKVKATLGGGDAPVETKVCLDLWHRVCLVILPWVLSRLCCFCLGMHVAPEHAAAPPCSTLLHRVFSRMARLEYSATRYVLRGGTTPLNMCHTRVSVRAVRLLVCFSTHDTACAHAADAVPCLQEEQAPAAPADEANAPLAPAEEPAKVCACLADNAAQSEGGACTVEWPHHLHSSSRVWGSGFCCIMAV